MIGWLIYRLVYNYKSNAATEDVDFFLFFTQISTSLFDRK
jgi:hypothetical protein